VFVIGVFWKGANATAALTCMLFGTVVGGLRLILELIFVDSSDDNMFLTVFVRSNYLHFGLFSFIACTILLVAISYLTGKPDIDPQLLDKITWNWDKQICCFTRNKYVEVKDEDQPQIEDLQKPPVVSTTLSPL
jgi:hypothetical protein